MKKWSRPSREPGKLNAIKTRLRSTNKHPLGHYYFMCPYRSFLYRVHPNKCSVIWVRCGF